MKQFKKLKRQADGFGHVELIIIVATVLVIGGAGYYVYNHSHKKSQVDSLTTADKSSSAAKPKPNVSPGAKTLTQANTGPNISATSSSKATSTPAIKIASPPTSVPSQSTSSSSASTTVAQAPTSALLATLTGIISSLENGQSAEVTSANIAIPGPISTAQGRPIVFNINGQIYFAYTQEQEPDFNTTASQTASTMAIVSSTNTSLSLTQAHIDQSKTLVDQNDEAVGYSTGGN